VSVPVSEYMTQFPKTIGHDMLVTKAKSYMQELDCHHLPVLDGGKLVGVLSDRDIALVERTDGWIDTVVEDLMADEPICVSADTDISEAVQLMLDKKINSLIVNAEDSTPWGVFTSTDALRFFIS